MGTDVVDDWALEVWDLDVPAFAIDGLLHAVDLVEFEGTVTWLYVVDARLPQRHKGQA